MTRARDDAERLSAVMNALADDVEALSDEQVLADAAARGADVKAEAAQVRNVLLGGILKAKKRRLQLAAVAHREAATAVQQSRAELPRDPGARRALLARTFATKPQYREAAVTFQCRNLDALPDEDVESILSQLAHLGALDDDDPKSEP